jgi:hypothetical protein
MTSNSRSVMSNSPSVIFEFIIGDVEFAIGDVEFAIGDFEFLSVHRRKCQELKFFCAKPLHHPAVAAYIRVRGAHHRRNRWRRRVIIF